MAPWILSSAVVTLLAALIWWFTSRMGVVLRTLSVPQPPVTHAPAPPFDDKKLWDEIERLTKAIAHGIDHVDRNEKRVRGIVTGAVKRFENSEYYDAAVDAELDSLPEETPEREEREPLTVTVPSSVEDEDEGDAAAGMIPGDWR